MTRAEKFKKVFGKEPDTSVCPLDEFKCESGCDTCEKCEHLETWWNEEFKQITCRDCQYLNWDVKTTVGYRCERPNYVHKSRVGQLKYPSSVACKGFKAKENI